MAEFKKEDIQAEAMNCFKTIEHVIGKTNVKLRELSKTEMDALDKINFEQKPDGSGPVEDKDGKLTIIDVMKYYDNWIAATMEPKFTADEVKDWPFSLKKELLEKAKIINGIEPADTTAKN
jgi:hypothetical protein